MRLLVCIACEDEYWQKHLELFFATRVINGVTYVEYDVVLEKIDAYASVVNAKHKYGELTAIFVEV